MKHASLNNNSVQIAEGRLVYKGLLSSQEKATVDEILNALKSETLEIESDLASEYG